MASPIVTPLARPVRDQLRSAINIPSFPQILNELVQNALDAGATRIECWINLEKGNERLRVEDDGHGIDIKGLAHIGSRHSKFCSEYWRSGVEQ
jgi:DNA mismatch repair protein MLH3